VEINARGFISIDEFLRTSAANIFAAGDVTGRLMLVPQAIQDGFIAATNAVRGSEMKLLDQPAPIGSFTDPEYAQVGLTETKPEKSMISPPPASISNPPLARSLMAERLASAS
jgi:pyruvate/2-oxoglutarate dehydrogenase complex dihydrolipoamide dehydrogenase (E3) component